MQRVALVSSSPLVLAGLRAAFRDAREWEVVAAVGSLEEAIVDPSAAVDVLVTDTEDELPSTQPLGIGLVRLVDADAIEVRDWLTEGVSLLPLEANDAEIVAAASAACEGLVAVAPDLLARALRGAEARESVREATSVEPLTAREREVLEHMARGLGNRAIARTLSISEHTAKFHVSQILGKLQAGSRAEAVAKGLRYRLIPGLHASAAARLAP